MLVSRHQRYQSLQKNTGKKMSQFHLIKHPQLVMVRVKSPLKMLETYNPKGMKPGITWHPMGSKWIVYGLPRDRFVWWIPTIGSKSSEHGGTAKLQQTTSDLRSLESSTLLLVVSPCGHLQFTISGAETHKKCFGSEFIIMTYSSVDFS